VISRRTLERNVRARIWADRLRRAALRHTPKRPIAGPVAGVAQEFLQRLLGSAIFFWLAGKVVTLVAGPSPVYTFAVLGAGYSARTAYLKYRLSSDPDFKIRDCGCAGRRHDDTAKVLKSGESAFLGIPNGAIGVVLYVLLLVLQYTRHVDAEIALASFACCASAYLSYVMVARIRSLCTNCIHVSALNVLILLHFGVGL